MRVGGGEGGGRVKVAESRQCLSQSAMIRMALLLRLLFSARNVATLPRNPTKEVVALSPVDVGLTRPLGRSDVQE